MVNIIRILLIDNNHDFIESTRWFLEQEGYQIVSADTRDDGRAILESGEVDLAIVDMRLVNDKDEQDFSGLEMAKEIRTAIPKIICTQFPDYKAAVEALGPRAEGLPPAVDFVAKKEGPEALLTAVRKALNLVKKRGKIQSENPNDKLAKKEHVTIQFDQSQRLLLVKDKPVPLTPLEYSIMEYFFAHPNQVISHEEIVDKVLNEPYNDYSDKNRINNIIHRLRDKIEDEKNSLRYLHTVRGHGFKLTP